MIRFETPLCHPDREGGKILKLCISCSVVFLIVLGCFASFSCAEKDHVGAFERISPYGIYVAKGVIDTSATLEELGIDDMPPALTKEEKQATVFDLMRSRSGVYHPPGLPHPYDGPRHGSLRHALHAGRRVERKADSSRGLDYSQHDPSLCHGSAKSYRIRLSLVCAARRDGRGARVLTHRSGNTYVKTKLGDSRDR